MSDLARRADQEQDQREYTARAEKLKAAYFDTFYDPATAVLAGWKSADGNLHDYYFTFVNGVAITGRASKSACYMAVPLATFLGPFRNFHLAPPKSLILRSAGSTYLYESSWFVASFGLRL